MFKFSYFLPFLAYCLTQCFFVQPLLNTQIITTKTYMFWPNGTVPFYIMPQHFDLEQKMVIMNALSTFAFQTCVKFFPVLTMPKEQQHVLTFANPDGTRRCALQSSEHNNFLSHRVIVGYECLKSPEIEMIIMRALGLPFEHTRMSRDVYIDVLLENVEPHAVQLFARDSVLPPVMRALPYDINSVMHFGERDYSKNGHRTIIFKNHNIRQNRVGLTANDLRKIELIYGPECRKRDRQEKFELCQAYPGVVRRKRDIELTEPPANKSLRVNRNITPPPTILNLAEATPLNETQADNTTDAETDGANYITESLKYLGIANETEDIIEKVYKVSALALKNAREKYCNMTGNNSDTVTAVASTERKKKSNSTDILGVLEVIADYAKSMVDHAIQNLTTFCESSKSIEEYQRQCSFGDNSRCPKSYRSTKSGAVKYSTQHRPGYKQPTRHEGRPVKGSYNRFRRIDDTQITTPSIKPRRKREVSATPAEDAEDQKVKEIKLKDKGKIKDTASTKSEKKSSVAKTKKEDKKESKKLNADKNKVDEKKPRRFFEESRFQRKSPVEGLGEEWEDSNVSLDLEKGGGTIVRLNAQKESGIDTAENEKESEADKVIDKEDLVKEVLNEGLDSILGGNNDEKDNNQQTVLEDNEEDEEGEEDEADGVDAEEKDHGGIMEEDESQKEKSDKEDTLDVEKSEEKLVEDVKEETTDEKPKIEKDITDVAALSVHNDNQDKYKVKNKENKVMKEKARSRKRKRSHGDLPETVKLNKLNKEFYNERRWPDGVVRYVIKKLPGYDLEDLRNRLAEVNNILVRKTCVKLVEVDSKEARGYDDYLVLDNSPDYVTGRVGGKQIFGCVELFKGDQHVQHTAMMVMAMLGFYFEVSRHDRDRHIRVHMRHVRPDKLHHFEKIRDEATLDMPYDYQSATHPAWQFWRKIGKTGISTVATYKDHDPDGSIMRSLGQNNELLSQGDIIKINSVYGVHCFQNRAPERTKKSKHKSKKSKKNK
ncbi:uncharacterized protein LOC111360052, partial [Spodoptera litura]|uniref:Metalloendopeptidase n=1 Tax=Spodoptera litura TaxID=69820 RepID=A0A9J7EN09_SPOLT